MLMYCKMELDSTAFMQGIKTSGTIRLLGLLDSLQIAALCAELRRKVYTDAKSVAQWIKCTFGVSYTPQGTVDLPNRIGFAYKKTAEVPCEADAQEQEEFVEELAKTLRDMDSSAVVYYAGGVHSTHNSRSTYAWLEKGERMEQPTVSGLNWIITEE
ncbi:MAG: winged helix-turn-helix domain-containing protein [Prevotella sp.]